MTRLTPFGAARPLLSIAVAAFAAAAFASKTQVKTRQERDIPYAEPERCRLDVKWPVGQTNFPTVVWFHGGGLVGGNKHFISIDDGIAQVAANYRLLGISSRCYCR